MDATHFATLALGGVSVATGIKIAPPAFTWLRSLFAAKVADSAAVTVAKEQHAAVVDVAREETGRHVAVARISASEGIMQAAMAFGAQMQAAHSECEEDRRRDRDICAKEIDEIRKESRAFIDNATAMDSTFQQMKRELDEYKRRHPSDPRMAAVKPT